MGVKILFLSLTFQAFSVIFSNGYSTVKYHDVSPATPTPVRLVNGFDRYSGRVEVFYRGRWGTICDDAFDRDDLHVICRMLGMNFGSSRGVVYTNAFFGYGSGPITIDDLQCKGNENDIAQCPVSPWLSHNCGHSEDVGVDCRGTRRHYDSTQQVPYATFGLTTNGYDRFGRIRLVNGQTERSGRVEVYYNGRWGTVCDDKFDNRDARVICRALFGYANSGYDMVRRNAYYGQGSGDIIIDELQCNGDEYSISYCHSNPWYTHDCTHSEDVGVDCDSRDYIYYGMTTEAPTARSRLVNGNSNSGRLEIYHNGEWMSVCENALSHDDVRVICRELGFDYGYRYGRVYGSGTYGQGSSYHIIYAVNCRGDENNVSKCAIYDKYKEAYGYCRHYQDAGIDCGAFYDGEITTQPPVSVTAGRGVRLVNGYSTYGRVEIYHNGEWMTVCENTLSHNDVRVICRELGYYYGSQYGRIFGSSTYGSGSSYHIVHTLNCGGYESHISQCSIQSSTRNSRCYHYQDAGIDCGAYYIEHTTVRQYPTSVAPNSVRLVNGNGRYSGRVEIYHNGEWMNVCYRYLSQDDVRVICRQLGYFRGYEYGSIKGTGYYGQGSSYYIIDDLSCNGNENSLSQCSVTYHSQGYYCWHTNDAGIDCYEYNPEPTTEAYNDGQVRLVGGASYAGRVEVYHNHQWMTVCSNTLDENDIKTICRSLGYYYGDNRGYKTNFYGQGSTYNIIGYLHCRGYEFSLTSCAITYSYANDYCSHNQDAGINCRGYYYETTTSNPYWHIQTTAGSVLEDAILVSCNELGHYYQHVQAPTTISHSTG